MSFLVIYVLKVTFPSLVFSTAGHLFCTDSPFNVYRNFLSATICFASSFGQHPLRLRCYYRQRNFGFSTIRQADNLDTIMSGRHQEEKKNDSDYETPGTLEAFKEPKKCQSTRYAWHVIKEFYHTWTNAHISLIPHPLTWLPVFWIIGVNTNRKRKQINNKNGTAILNGKTVTIETGKPYPSCQNLISSVLFL